MSLRASLWGLKATYTLSSFMEESASQCGDLGADPWVKGPLRRKVMHPVFAWRILRPVWSLGLKSQT